MVALRSFAPFGIALLLAACAAGEDRQGFEPVAAPPGSTQPPPSETGSFDQEPTPPAPEVPEVHEVWAHSATALYKLEPKTKQVTVIGDFKGCEKVNDIALDEKSVLYAVSKTTLYTVDKKTVECTPVNTSPADDYPMSLSFVPKGTVDANAEALVGYIDGDYMRIDMNDGSQKKLGSLGGNLISSGDIVSVKGGKTYLSVKAGSCNTTDCLVEVDPKNGKMLKNWGSIEHKNVFGLTFWGGNVYGFDSEGNLFEVVFGTSKIVTKAIPIPQKPAGLSFWGAGSSTSAPLTSEPQ
jgi:hypothetical protein